MLILVQTTITIYCDLIDGTFIQCYLTDFSKQPEGEIELQSYFTQEEVAASRSKMVCQVDKGSE